jgi:Do/DeqQ family serine protease
MKKIVSYVFIALLAGIVTLGGYKLFFEQTVVKQVSDSGTIEQPQIVKTHFVNSPNYAAETTDFTKAASETVDAVVHVKNTAIQTYRDPFQELFYGRSGGRQFKQVGTGSGVIISSDGYIITNNHVVANATEIQITLNNKKEYKAELIGSDEANDIALVKIDATDLPYITFADSDNVKIGEWVLAVGNPYNLTSTVTAGIVSAKGRDLDGNNKIESYIQTDAAVNPGNSGGALVNTRGELIGINTAISSQTGSFVGYSFAVPSNIARKVVEDLMEFGNVQRAVLGISIVELNGENYEDLGADISEGIYVSKVFDNGAAADSGLQEKDIIIKINNNTISKFSDLKGQLSSHRPGETVQVTVIRNDEEMTIPVVLKNKFGKEVLGSTDYIDNVLGMELKELSNKQKNNYNIDYGVSITKINNPSFARFGIQKGAIILAIERQKVYTTDDVERLLRENENNTYVTLQILNTNNKIEFISLKL